MPKRDPRLKAPIKKHTLSQDDFDDVLNAVGNTIAEEYAGHTPRQRSIHLHGEDITTPEEDKPVFDRATLRSLTIYGTGYAGYRLGYDVEELGGVVTSQKLGELEENIRLEAGARSVLDQAFKWLRDTVDAEIDRARGLQGPRLGG